MANNDLNTNDLYQMIAANKAEADKVAVLAANTPTFQSNMQSGIVGGDKTLSSATSNYSDAVAELFAHDKNMAASNTTPSFAPEGYVSNPMTKESYSANLFAEKGAMVANTLKDMETRKALLGDLVGKAVDVYKYAVQSKQISVDAGAKSIDQLSKLLSDAQSQKNSDRDYNLELAKLTGNSTGVTAVDSMSDAEAVAKIKDVYGPNIDLGAVQKERGARAKLLLAKIYNGEQVDYRDLLTPADVTKLDEATASLQGADRALATFNKYNEGKDSPGGTGWLTGKVNEGTLLAPIFLGEKERDLRRAVIDVSSAYQKFLSGVAVSAQEMVRLEGLLPSQKKPESANVSDLIRLKRGMEINLELDKMAKLNKLSPDQAYKKFGPDIFAQYGEVFPGSNNTSNSSTNVETIKNNLKSSGYSEQEINDYLKAKGL